MGQIKDALQKGDGLVYVLVGFQAWLGHKIHRDLKRDNNLYEKQVVEGYVFDKLGNVRATLDWDKGKMASMFGISPENAERYAEAIKKKIVQCVRELRENKL